MTGRGGLPAVSVRSDGQAATAGDAARAGNGLERFARPGCCARARVRRQHLTALYVERDDQAASTYRVGPQRCENVGSSVHLAARECDAQHPAGPAFSHEHASVAKQQPGTRLGQVGAFLLGRDRHGDRLFSYVSPSPVGHLLMEDRNGLVVDAGLTHATGTAERDTAAVMPGRSRPAGGSRWKPASCSTRLTVSPRCVAWARPLTSARHGMPA